MTLKCSDFVKNCMGGLYCIANLLGVGRKKKHLRMLWILFNPLQTEKKKNIPITNVKTKVFL